MKVRNAAAWRQSQLLDGEEDTRREPIAFICWTFASSRLGGATSLPMGKPVFDLNRIIEAKPAGSSMRQLTEPATASDPRLSANRLPTGGSAPPSTGAPLGEKLRILTGP